MRAQARLMIVAIMTAVWVPACTSGHHANESPLRDRPLPTPVTVRTQPEGTIADAAFTALPGARAEYGRLGGAAYEIEIPDKWNGRVLLWMHGFDELSGELKTGPPKFRRWLNSHGFAWAASSFSSTSLIPGRAADETAALWDYFVAKHGRPTWTYAAGASMGGWAAAIVAQRYGNRFNGALGMCGAVGAVPAVRIDTDFFVVAAFVAGVTQAEFDATTDLGKLIDERIVPALERPAARTRFEDIVISLTGGPRAFDRAGLETEMATKFRRAGLVIAAHLVPPGEAPHRLGPGSPVTSAEFNRRAIRLPSDARGFRAFTDGTEVTGKLAIPLLTLHSTGDEQVPINQAQILRARVHAAGRDALLAQRVIKDPGHCGFSVPEQEAALAALVAWVEHGKRPATTNLGVSDLRTLDRTFELVPRAGSPGEQAPDDSVSIHGLARLDGRPFDASFIGAVVIDRGLVTPCNVTIPTIVAGRFELEVYGEQSSAGCGRRGSQVVLWTYAGAQKQFATKPLGWPSRRAMTASVDFSTSAPSGAAPTLLELSGEAIGTDGVRVPAGTRVEAFVGDTLCGVASVRTGVFDGYILHVVGPDSVPGCRTGATVTFRIGGKPAVETRRNGGVAPRSFDLTVR